ncbi:MMPL family transporter [uncultured Rikenella sp.]|uniref:MMPL family transporter n=1 Tax=uncultured Rikenella sp. TaxID=368003 RepID=UPI002635BF89|nr:trifunctional MMPL family transporter/lysophospholipid acyltransferase/class I SAM-dependent methyltransferase [uncultured Rikenella sp.]
MSNFFVRLYDWFRGHRLVFWLLLAGWAVGTGALVLRMRFVEDITSFFAGDDAGRKQALMFRNLKLKDRIVLLLSEADPDTLISAGDRLVESLAPLVDEGLLSRVTEGVDATTIHRSADFVYDHLPIFLRDDDYARLDSLLRDDRGVEQAVERCFATIASPSGLFAGEFCLRDPLGIGSSPLAGLQRFSAGNRYELYGDRIFSADGSTLFLFADPAHGLGSTDTNDRLVGQMEAAIARVRKETGVRIDYFGGPAVAVYNARQIKHDTMLTLTLALLAVVAVITFALRSRGAVLLILLPVLFGTLFALAAIYLAQGRISSIAIGAGAAVLGIALSYSIHIVSHHTHTDDPRRVIAELAYPLTVGSITTIGAFVALLFTHSGLLQDFGAFASLTLMGTTLFCLVFLPHFLSDRRKRHSGRLFRLIDRLNGYSYERNRWIVGSIVLATIGCAFFYNDVRFDTDLHHLNFEPRHILEAQHRLERLTEGEGETTRVFLLTSAPDNPGTAAACATLGRQLDTLLASGRIVSYATAGDYFVSAAEQERRIDAWNTFWATRSDTLIARLEQAAARAGFSDHAFDAFSALLRNRYTVCDYSSERLADVPLFSDWINAVDTTVLLVSQIELAESDKTAVYAALETCDDTVILDRAYYSSQMIRAINDDFYFILLVSSFLVFGALLLSYGSLELALLSLLPMFVSWVIILGIMALYDIPFNIVNIILSTFIFGIGDDFSIFILDGLLSEYRDGRKLFRAHKTAIFFSAFTTIAGLGALLFAQHPALRSIALISVVGLSVVILVSYTLQPILFARFISSPVQHGGFPYTLRDLGRTAYAFLLFLGGCLTAQLLLLVSLVLPIRHAKKQAALHRLICAFVRGLLRIVPSTRVRFQNLARERFDRPAVIIANHQSSIDILLLLALSPKIVLVTNGRVWRSPILGPIVRYLGYFHTAAGYEAAVGQLREKVAAGYSVALFPEGTRSVDRTIGRFHKGAFYLADRLGLDLLPAVIYGAGEVCSKRQSLYIKPGWIVCRLLPRVSAGDPRFGTTLRKQAKSWRRWYVEQYAALCDEYDRARNPYFRNALRKNYLYKGPLLMHRIRREAARADYYDAWDQALPRDAAVTELGCGYGARAVMLGLLSRQRRIVGLDPDEERIRIARHGFLNDGNISFGLLSDETELPHSDIFLVNGPADDPLLDRCLSRLRPGGSILLTDPADATRPEIESFARRHGLVLRAEAGRTVLTRNT